MAHPQVAGNGGIDDRAPVTGGAPVFQHIRDLFLSTTAEPLRRASCYGCSDASIAIGGEKVFDLLFIGGVVGFLAVEGIVLVWQGRRIRRLEDKEWKVRLR